MTDNGPDIIDTDGEKRGEKKKKEKKQPTEGHIQIGRLRGALDSESSVKATCASVRLKWHKLSPRGAKNKN